MSHFKRIASRQTVASACALGYVFILGANLVLSTLLVTIVGIIGALAVRSLIGSVRVVQPL